MRLWIARDVKTPMHEQLSAQLLLGIISRELPPGQRLPSVRALARRLRIHPNTVMSVYRDLARRGWVEARRGSGVFVRAAAQRAGGGPDDFVAAWVEEAAIHGYSIADLQSALSRLAEPPKRSLLVVDSDLELARILAAEIAEALGYAVDAAEIGDAARVAGSQSLVLFHNGRSAQIASLSGHLQTRRIRLSTMEELLRGRRRPAGPTLVGVATRSRTVAGWASTLLSALGFAPESVVIRNPSEAGWERGLSECGIVGADIVSTQLLASLPGLISFRLVSPDSIAELRELVTDWKPS